MTSTDTIPNTEMAQRIYAIHEWYCENGVRIVRTPEVERSWKMFFDAGYTAEDQLCVLQYLKRQIFLGKRLPGAVTLTSLMGLDPLGQLRFTTDLGLARAKLHVPGKFTPLPASVAASAPRPQPSNAPAAAQPAPSQAPTEEQRARRLQEIAAFKRSLTETITADKSDAL